jgi:hypothetical protein
MKRLLLLFAALIAGAAHAETWRFALIGDTPYSDYERRELPRMLDAIAAENLDFIVHAGDIKHSRDACSNALFADRKALFDASALPLVYVPGDNEWTDCDRLSAGHFDPLERLQRLRQVFYADDASLGQHRIPLERQQGDFREHQRWRMGPLLFITLNVPGGNNNWHRTGEESWEAAARMPKVLAWLQEGFAIAKAQQLRGIVITMQANPGFKHYRAGLPHGGYRALLDTLRKETQAFPGQVLLVHGDTHWQRVDQPLFDPQTGKRIGNFTRAETFGYPYLGWTKVIVDDTTPELFRFEVRGWGRLTP